jgi:hypothetical protein
MEKVKLSVKGEVIEIYDSISPKRLDEETREEYLLRRKVINDLEKAKRKTRNWEHISVSLIPAQTPEGKVLINKNTNQPTWIGITKGTTYVKQRED